MKTKIRSEYSCSGVIEDAQHKNYGFRGYNPPFFARPEVGEGKGFSWIRPAH
jgi:hypothetical protein